MKIQELRAAVKKSPKVFGWVMITQDHGIYAKLEKKNILLQMKGYEGETFDAEIKDCGNLYIN